MADIYQISLKHGLSIKKLKIMERDGFLRTTKSENPEISQMIYTYKKGNNLSAFNLAILIENPDWIAELGSYSKRARKQIAELGDVKGQAANPSIANEIDRAFDKIPEYVAALELSIKNVIPPDREVSHHYVAVRLLLSASVHSRRYVSGRIMGAFQNVKAKPSFADWFTRRPAPYARNATFYHRPKKKFDL